MRFVQSVIVCSVVWSSMHVQAGAAGKLTVDPNTPGAQVEAAAPDTDTRLAQKVTYEARHKTVVTILADLSVTTGVTLRAGYNSQDWQVRDRKMNIFAKNALLADLMNSIARVMKFKWSRSEKDGVYSYRLYMDRKTLLDADAQTARMEERIQEKFSQKRQKLLDNLEKADSLSDEDLAKMKSEDPSSYWTVVGPESRGLGKLCREIPDLAWAVVTGQELTVSSSQLSAVCKDTVLEMMKSIDEDRAREGFPDVHFPADAEKTSVKIIIPRDPGSTLLEMVAFNWGSGAYCWGYGGLDGFDPATADLLKAHKAEIVELGERLRDPKLSEDEKIALNDKLGGLLYSLNIAVMDPGEQINEHPDDPALARKIKLEPKSTLLQDVQHALAESSGFAVVSDCFGMAETYGVASRDEVEIEIKALLDKITKPCQYNWDKHGQVIEFRDRYWFRKRSAQIPEAWIEAWRQALKKNETLDIAELARIAWLTPEQFSMNVKDDEVLSSAPASDSSTLSSLVMFKQDVLRAYGALTENERNKLFSSSGLNLSEVSGDRRVVVDQPIARRNPAFLLNPEAQITVTAKRVQKAKQFEYTLTATTSDSLVPIVWSFTTPKYKPPESKQPRASDPKSNTEKGR